MAHYFHPIDPFLLSEITERLVKKKKSSLGRPLLSPSVVTLNRGRVSTVLGPSRVEPVWERRRPRAGDINIFTLKYLVLFNARKWHRHPLTPTAAVTGAPAICNLLRGHRASVRG